MENNRHDFASFRKIDAHSHIGSFGSPFNVDFNTELLARQMDEYNIEKTILCPAGAHLNEELNAAWHAMPERIIPLCWVNANLGTQAYDMLEHYLRDEGFAGVKMQPLFEACRCSSIPCIRSTPCPGALPCWRRGTRR